MVTALSNFLNNSSLLNKASLGLCTVASLELGCRSIMNLNALRTSEEDTTQVREDLSGNLGRTFIFALAAANPFPGIRKFIAIALTIRSISIGFSLSPIQQQQYYWVERAIAFFPVQAHQGYKCVKSHLPKHPSWVYEDPSWVLLILLVGLVGQYHFGGKVAEIGVKIAKIIHTQLST